MISVRELTFGYEEKDIFKDVNFDFLDGKITTIVGPNGSGKSTLLALIAKLLETKIGKIEIQGKPINHMSRKDIAKKLSIVFQQNQAPSDITVRNLVSYGRNPHKGYFEQLDEEDEKIIDWALKQAGLESFCDKLVSHMSGGEKQRVWIALSLAQMTNIILLDEPTTYLDIHHQLEILDLIRRINLQNNTTVISVLHDINLAIRYSDYLIFLKDGKIVSYGKPDEIVTEELLLEVFNVKAKILRDDGLPYVIVKDYLKRWERYENFTDLLECNR